MIELKKDNIIVILYVIMAAVYTSPLCSMRIFNLVLVLMPYLNLFFIVLGIYYVFQYKDVTSLYVLTLITAVLFSISIINGTSKRHIIDFLSIIIGMYYTTSITYHRESYKILFVTGLFYNFVTLICSREYYLDWFTNEATMNPNTIGIMTFFFAILVNSYVMLYWEEYVRNVFVLIYNISIMYILYVF